LLIEKTARGTLPCLREDKKTEELQFILARDLARVWYGREMGRKEVGKTSPNPSYLPQIYVKLAGKDTGEEALRSAGKSLA